MGGMAIIMLSLIPVVMKLSGIDTPINNLTLSRLAIFSMGIIMGIMNIRGKYPSKKTVRLSVTAAIFGVLSKCIAVRIFSHDRLWETMLFWLPFIFIVPGLLLILSMVVDMAPVFLQKFLCLWNVKS